MTAKKLPLQTLHLRFRITLHLTPPPHIGHSTSRILSPLLMSPIPLWWTTIKRDFSAKLFVLIKNLCWIKIWVKIEIVKCRKTRQHCTQYNSDWPAAFVFLEFVIWNIYFTPYNILTSFAVAAEFCRVEWLGIGATCLRSWPSAVFKIVVVSPYLHPRVCLPRTLYRWVVLFIWFVLMSYCNVLGRRFKRQWEILLCIPPQALPKLDSKDPIVPACKSFRANSLFLCMKIL